MQDIVLQDFVLRGDTDRGISRVLFDNEPPGVLDVRGRSDSGFDNTKYAYYCLYIVIVRIIPNTWQPEVGSKRIPSEAQVGGIQPM